jgi:hypothetical protein
VIKQDEEKQQQKEKSPASGAAKALELNDASAMRRRWLSTKL